ncbi:MAG: NUDIX domain-containing protein [Actinomycetia bacterium]|nr:NUDIX domain-containing protein [Actinomycetes bacterium]
MTDLRGWRLCPRCGADLARDSEAVRCRACGYAAYASPAPTIGAIVLDREGARVLLGRRGRDQHAGLWDTLGGFAHEGEDALETLAREIREETGAEIEPLAFIGGFADRYGPDGGATLNFYWTARLVSGEPAADDVVELRWFPVEALPPDEEIAFANTARALRQFQTMTSSARPTLGVFEVQLVTRDLDRLARFYRDVLKLAVTMWDITRGRVHFGLATGQLILAAAEGEETSPDWPGLPPPLLVRADARGPTPREHGAVHFALQVLRSRLFEEGERLRREGLDVRGPFRWPDGYQSLYFRDPDGNVVELIA